VTNFKVALALVVAAVLLVFALAAAPFDGVITGLYVAGVIMSGAFVLTWFPMALRALLHHQRDVSFVRILDYAGLQLVVFLAFILILRTVFTYGISDPQDNVAIVSRVLLPLMLDVIIGLRLWKWILRIWEARHEGGPSDVLPGHDTATGE
jgi:hypothetical protein